jgi:hypothetical protein
MRGRWIWVSDCLLHHGRMAGMFMLHQANSGLAFGSIRIVRSAISKVFTLRGDVS